MCLDVFSVIWTQFQHFKLMLIDIDSILDRYYIIETQNCPTLLYTVTCWARRSPEMGGYSLPNAPPLGGAGRGRKYDLSLQALIKTWAET